MTDIDAAEKLDPDHDPRPERVIRELLELYLEVAATHSNPRPDRETSIAFHDWAETQSAARLITAYEQLSAGVLDPDWPELGLG